MMRVGDLTAPATTVGPDTPVREAVARMTAEGLTLLPVLSGGALVGVLHEADLLGGRVRHAPGGHGNPTRPQTVGEVMARPYGTVSPWTDLAEAVVLMADRGLHSLPVVREGVFAGVVTRREVASVLGRSDPHLRAAVALRLDGYAGRHKWEVHAHRGEVVLCDEEDDPLEQHIATVLAAGIPGTVHVATYRRDVCPEHTAAA
ncbi:HPP family protein [Actinomycetospora cinnamomea]|uniref:CBS domain protein n=1 Tax=Actinomycetospora cinnamomea TaxID=663609 RepID=A0A2U1F444_9PSEU|nr:CBS domain-containing protein [Actinomycetospora cinnamomea]PVZ06932.1 CBS domain protein [Actinomycetospora cinnamomea]